jgi:hypothetical protein
MTLSTMDKSSILNVNLTEYTPVASTEKVDRSGWVCSGLDNLFPYYLRDLAESSPIHGALCISISDMIAGKGVKSNTNQERVDALITDEVRMGCSSDLKKFGGYYIEVIYTVDRKSIAKLRHLPYEECRIAVTGEDEEVIGIYQSDDWANIRKKKNKPVFLPKFNPQSVQEEPRQVYWCFDYTGGQIYPKPDYYSAVNYIELSKQIGIYHVSNILNGMFPSLIVSLFNGQLDPDGIRKMKNDMEFHLGGARNSGKTFFTFNEPGSQPPDIKSFPLSDADKQYEYLTNTSRQEVLLAHRCTTPLIFGIRDVGGGFGSNKEEMVIGLEIFTKQVVEPKQRKLAKGFETVLGFEIKGVQIAIIPNTPLMTEQGATATEPLAPAEAPDSEIPAEPAPLAASSEKKNIQLNSDVQMTSEDEQYWRERLQNCGEIIDLDEWELVHEDDAIRDAEVEKAFCENLQEYQLQSLEGYAEPDKKSAWGDRGMYKLRYAYSQNLSDESREFCVDMVALSKQGTVYRYEDIQLMSDAGVNGQFAPTGKSQYDLFKYVGGCFCHHHWKRQIYFRKRSKGKFLPNKGLQNDMRVGNVPYVKKKGIEGVAPIDRPGRGSLKYG